MNLSLAGKFALVGGGSKGIGLASAKALSELGASCTLLARNEEVLKKAVASLDVSQGQVHGYLVVDNSDLEGLKETVSRYINSTQNPYQILINNTGGPPGGPLYEANLEAFEQAYKQHLLSNHQLLKLVLPRNERDAGMEGWLMLFLLPSNNLWEAWE